MKFAQSSSTATLIVVRRDASAIFQRLEPWARSPGSDVTLVWDRRTGDRRHYDAAVLVERRMGERREPSAEGLAVLDQPRRGDRRQQPESRMPERRHTERRRRVPNTWGTLGFLVVCADNRRQ
jgi:hypothetical protein